MESDWLTCLLVVLFVTIAVGLLWSGTLFSGGPKPAPVIIESPVTSVETKEKKKPRQRVNAQQSLKETLQDISESKEEPSSVTIDQDTMEESVPSRSPRKRKAKTAKRDESLENTVKVIEEASSAGDGTWQTQLSRQQKQEMLRQRRQQENVQPSEDSIEKQIATATDEVITAANDSKTEDELMYLESHEDADAWLVINDQTSSI